MQERMITLLFGVVTNRSSGGSKGDRIATVAQKDTNLGVLLLFLFSVGLRLYL